MATIPDPLERHRGLLASMVGPLEKYRALVTSLPDPLEKHRALLASISDPIAGHRASLANVLRPFEGLVDSIEHSRSLKVLAEDALATNSALSIEEDGNISLESEEFKPDEIQEAAGDILHEFSLTPHDSLEDAISNLVDTIESQNDTTIQKLLKWFVYPFLVAVLASLISQELQHQIVMQKGTDKRALSKEIKSNAKSIANDHSILDELRYVSADTLNVRQDASKKSEAIGILHFGQTVIVIDRRKSWTLIEWNDRDNHVQITGWVFSRYLNKFN